RSAAAILDRIVDAAQESGVDARGRTGTPGTPRERFGALTIVPSEPTARTTIGTGRSGQSDAAPVVVRHHVDAIADQCRGLLGEIAGADGAAIVIADDV